ncbi:MAG: CPBP family glutamic-type intramembrane protease [Gammaproteobacteria bacterium]
MDSIETAVLGIPAGSSRLPILKRLVLLVVLSALGGLLFVPFATTGSVHHSIYPWLLFPLAAAVVAALCAWGGLLAADRSGLPMPILRAWERGEPVDPVLITRILRFAVLVGIAAAAITLAGSIAFRVPKNPGTLLERLLTTPFAAVVTETFAHLLVLSAIVLWLKNRWVAILFSSLAYTLAFHGQPVGSLTITLFVFAFNFLFSTLTGWTYVRYGFLCAILTHAVAHGIVLGVN